MVAIPDAIYEITYYSNCSIEERHFFVVFPSFELTNVFAQEYRWKRTGAIIQLDAPYEEGYQYDWSTGSHNSSISVRNPGTYWVRVYNDCGEISDTIEVRDNVELYRATTNLRTNLNEVTWQVTEAQAAYVSEVKVYRNNQLIATVPYAEGAFTDDIGSEATQWQYHLVAVGHDGAACPIRSYWKRTIHLDHVQGTTGSEILQWTPYEDEDPDKATVLSYGIYDVVNGEPRPVIEVGNFTNVYAYDPDDFEGYGTVAAKFEGKGLEDLAFSNMTEDVLAVDASEGKAFRVYPNPAGGTFTVEGAREVTVTNTLGQTVAASRSEAGTHRLTLPPGVYFLKSETGTVRKVVVR